ncbi:MAG TPA: hypothetical protein VJ484_05085 [Lysobacter sp.]|nr:hypothetical protein [Lysobacter sp.]
MLLILQLAILLFFLVMACRVVIAVLGNSSIFIEFKQSRLLAALALLIPIGPLALIALGRYSVAFASVGAIACYLPVLVMSRRQLLAFERAGTDRVAGAINATHQAFGTALAGILYTIAVVVLGSLLSRL